MSFNGFLATIYTSNYSRGSTNDVNHYFGGANTVIITHIDDGNGPQEIAKSFQIFPTFTPACLYRRYIGGTPAFYVAPMARYSSHPIGPMHGGAIVSSSDSRWAANLAFGHEVALHDRFETYEMYKELGND